MPRSMMRLAARHPTAVATVAVLTITVTVAVLGDVGQMGQMGHSLGVENGTLVEPQDGVGFEGPTNVGGDDG